MISVQAKLMEVARSIRPGSNARLIVLRATEEGIANLLKPAPRQRAPVPTPTVLPSRTTPPGMPGIALARQAERLLAGQTAALVTEAYVQAGARPAAPSAGESARDASLPVPVSVQAHQGTPTAGLDPRAVALPAPIAHAEEDGPEWAPTRGSKRRTGKAGGPDSASDTGFSIDRGTVLAAGAGLFAILAVMLVWAIAG